MSAAAVLAAAGLLSDELTAQFRPIRLEQIRLIRAPSWFIRLWGEKIKAVTLFRTILVDTEVLDGDPRRLGILIVHELTHVRQWVDGGWFGFTLPYVSNYLKARFRGLSHWEAYRSNPFEVEARAMADRFRGAG